MNSFLASRVPFLHSAEWRRRKKTQPCLCINGGGSTHSAAVWHKLFGVEFLLYEDRKERGLLSLWEWRTWEVVAWLPNTAMMQEDKTEEQETRQTLQECAELEKAQTALWGWSGTETTWTFTSCLQYRYLFWSHPIKMIFEVLFVGVDVKNTFSTMISLDSWQHLFTYQKYHNWVLFK